MARPFIPVPNTAVFDFNQVLDGVPFCNSVYFYYFVSPWDVTLLEQMCIALDTWYQTNMLPLQGSDLIYNGVTGTSLESSGGATFQLNTGGVFGGYSDVCMPLNCAIYIRTRPPLWRGRNYYYYVFGGIPKVVCNGPMVDPGYRAALFDAYITWQDVDPGLGVDAVHVKYIVDGAYLSEGDIFGFGFTSRIKPKIGTRARRVRNKPRP